MLQRSLIRSVILAPSLFLSSEGSIRGFRFGRVFQGFSTGSGFRSSVPVVRGAVNREGFTAGAALKKAEDQTIKMWASSLSQIKLFHLLLMLFFCVLYPLFMYSEVLKQPVEGGVAVKKQSVSMQRFPHWDLRFKVLVFSSYFFEILLIRGAEMKLLLFY